MEAHYISLEKIYSAQSSAVIDQLKKNLFILTGADEIEGELKAGSEFRLVFHKRGVICGCVMHSDHTKLILEWNVEGFQNPAELKTLVTISLKQDGANCILHLEHNNILNSTSATAKKRAWTEILNDLSKCIDRPV